jgi:hypothetical protein
VDVILVRMVGEERRSGVGREGIVFGRVNLTEDACHCQVFLREELFILGPFHHPLCLYYN